jgi:plasmid maintenance system antidote protein VapI
MSDLIYCTPGALRDFMAKHDLSARQTAEAIGCGKSFVYAMLNGTVPVPLTIALALAAVDAKLKPYGGNST